jgi:formate C-acetyltransferase
MSEYMNRINRLKARLLETRPEMDLENASILTDGFQEMDGYPLVIKKAHAFRKQCQEKTITIADDELIVGNAGSKIRGGILSADSCWSVLDRELDTISTRKYDPFFLKDEDKEMFVEKIRPYWKGRSVYEEWVAQAPEEATVLRDNGVIYIDRKAVRGFGETTAGYAWLLQAGVKGIIETIQERRSRLVLTDPGAIDKDNYLKALLIVAEGIVILANRYAALAEEMAAK